MAVGRSVGGSGADTVKVHDELPVEGRMAVSNGQVMSRAIRASFPPVKYSRIICVAQPLSWLSEDICSAW